MKTRFPLFLMGVISLCCIIDSNAQTFLAPVSFDKGAITQNAGSFYYSAGGSRYPNYDVSYIPFTHSSLTTTAPWNMSIYISIPSAVLDSDDTLSAGFSIGPNVNNGLDSAYAKICFKSGNHAGTGVNETPDNAYGDFVIFSAQADSGTFQATTPVTPYSSWDGSSYYQLNGGYSSTPISNYVSQPIIGFLRLSFDGTSEITGYFNGNALGSYNISSWGNSDLVGTVWATSAGWTGDNQLIASNLNVVPEPSTYTLFGIGLFGMLVALRRRVNA